MSEEKVEKMFYDLKCSIECLSKQQKEEFEKIDKKLKEYKRQEEEEFEKINKKLEEYKRLGKADFERIIKLFKQHEEKQRHDFARLEQVMYDRTEALFDARECSLEKDEDLYSRIKSIDKILEKHHYRITELESKVN